MRASALFLEIEMSEERTRRVKCYVLKPIYLDPNQEDFSGDAAKIAKGQTVLLSNVQYEHYRRHNCVTKDLPLEGEADGSA